MEHIVERFGGKIAVPVAALPEATGGIDARHWAAAIRSGDLPVVMLSARRRLVLISDLEAYLRARKSS